MSVSHSELRRAAQSISPRWFDRIALQYLHIRQVSGCIIKHVLLAEAQHRRMHTALGWV